MRLSKGFIGVEFDKEHNNSYKIGDVTIVRPEMWEFENSSHNESGTMFQKNTNLKETNPQIAVVTTDCEELSLKIGDVVFTHYLAINNAQQIEDLSVISTKSVFFQIKGDEFIMMEDIYLGQQVYTDLVKTESGIYLTSDEQKKETLKIKLTHVPKNSMYFSVGDTVLTVDDNQYEIDVYGGKHIKLNTWDIAIKINE